MPLAPEAINAIAGTAVRVQLARRAALSTWQPMAHQCPPAGTDWDTWLLLAGRGAGKTDACAAYVDAQARRSPIRIGIIAPTLGDAVDACVVGPSGIRAHNPAVQMHGGLGGAYLLWPNGSRAKLFGASTADDVERLRAGGNRHLDWYEELAAWRYGSEALEQAAFGLRLGDRPHAVASTTPKPRKHLIDLLARPTTAITRATTDDNPHLDARVRRVLFERYEGTRLGRQELLGELLEDVEGALWSRAMLDAARVPIAPSMARLVVAIDPAMTSGEDADETGMVLAGKGVDGHGYLLADLSCRLSPDGWARRAVNAYREHGADRIVAEVNNGGDLVEATLRAVDKKVSYRKVTASRGKRVRAEPVAALYEQGKVHHVGGAFGLLEDQLCSFAPDNYDGSPDRLDALVWAFTELLLGGARGMEAW